MSLTNILSKALCLVIVLGLCSCQNSDNRMEIQAIDNYNHMIPNMQNVTKDYLWEVTESYRLRTRRPEIYEVNRETVQKLFAVSDSLQEQLKTQKIDCHLFINSLVKSYDLIENRYNFTVHAVQDIAKIKDTEIEDIQFKFKEKLDLKNLETNLCMHDPSLEYFYSELIKFNMSLTTFVLELSMFTSYRRPEFRRIPVALPSKHSYKPGDLFEADIYIGNFINKSTEKEQITINGKEYKLNNNKIEFQEVVPEQQGKRELKIIYKEENPGTKMFEGVSSVLFEYDIEE